MSDKHRYQADGHECAHCPLPASHPVHDIARPAPDTPVDPVRTGGAGASYPMVAKALPRSGTFKAELLALINTHPHGLTDDEMERLTGRSHQSVSAARNSLMHDGHIKAHTTAGQPVRRRTRYANEAQVWVGVSVDEAVAAFEQGVMPWAG